jgi:hypothetical protein
VRDGFRGRHRIAHRRLREMTFELQEESQGFPGIGRE